MSIKPAELMFFFAGADTLLVEFAESAKGVALRMSLTILFPDQLQRQVRIALEFFVKLSKIGLGLAGFVGASRSRSEKGGLQLAVTPTCGKRPRDPRGLGAFQILINRSLPDRATAGDLPLPQA
jgi:hypothetical protein